MTHGYSTVFIYL